MDKIYEIPVPKHWEHHRPAVLEKKETYKVSSMFTPAFCLGPVPRPWYRAGLQRW